MKNRLRIIFVVFATLLFASHSSAKLPSSETLSYKVLYKWGLIHKQAGTAIFTMSTKGNHYHARLTARSAGWADKFYPLRDTLITKMRTSDYAPVLYERIAHEDGKFAHDKLIFTHSGNKVTAQSTRTRRGKDSTESKIATTSLSAVGLTVDLLSSFYYLRSLPFGTMNPGKSQQINIFSGKKKELLTITYAGVSSVKIDGVNHQAYKVKFTFTSDGKKETSDPIEAWISMDSRQIPLKLVGKLKIGQIQCIYTGK